MRHTPNATRTIVLAILLLLTFTASTPLQAQVTSPGCQFSESQAVADTLDPRGYYPLAVGNVWEYIVKDGPFFGNPYRDEVIADTLIEDIPFFKIQRTTYTYDANVITNSTTQYVYRAMTDSSMLEWHNESIVSGAIRFDQDFNSCYQVGEFGLMEVFGAYDQNFGVEVDEDTVYHAVPALKQIGSEFLSTVYAWGVGPIRIDGDPVVVTSLTYVSTDEAVYGKLLRERFAISVANEEEARLTRSPEIELFPYPMRSIGTMRLKHAEAGAHTVTVYDLLGASASGTPFSRINPKKTLPWTHGLRLRDTTCLLLRPHRASASAAP